MIVRKEKVLKFGPRTTISNMKASLRVYIALSLFLASASAQEEVAAPVDRPAFKPYSSSSSSFIEQFVDGLGRWSVSKATKEDNEKVFSYGSPRSNFVTCQFLTFDSFQSENGLFRNQSPSQVSLATAPWLRQTRQPITLSRLHSTLHLTPLVMMSSSNTKSSCRMASNVAVLTSNCSASLLPVFKRKNSVTRPRTRSCLVCRCANNNMIGSLCSFRSRSLWLNKQSPLDLQIQITCRWYHQRKASQSTACSQERQGYEFVHATLEQERSIVRNLH